MKVVLDHLLIRRSERGFLPLLLPPVSKQVAGLLCTSGPQGTSVEKKARVVTLSPGLGSPEPRGVPLPGQRDG